MTKVNHNILAFVVTAIFIGSALLWLILFFNIFSFYLFEQYEIYSNSLAAGSALILGVFLYGVSFVIGRHNTLI